MRMPGHLSWRIAIDEPADLHLVLFVRDCYRLSTGGSGQPGPLAPAVPDLSGLMDEPMRYAASAAWQTWWQAAAEACGVASRPLPHDASSAARHYQAWPRYAAAVGPRFESLSHVPALRAAATAAFEPFQLWWAPPTFGGPQAQRRSGRSLGLPGVQGYLIDLHHGRSTVHDVVTRIERELGREAKPFDLSVDILAVTYPPVLVQGEHHAVVSGELVADETSYRDWLYDSIRPMA